LELDLTDTRLKCRVNFIGTDKARLILDFPAEPGYLDKLMSALSALMKLRFLKKGEPDDRSKAIGKDMH